MTTNFFFTIKVIIWIYSASKIKNTNLHDEKSNGKLGSENCLNI